MTPRMRRMPDPRVNLRHAFTLVEVLIVVVIMAILATVVAPRLANATAPLPQVIASTLEIDMRRAAVEATGRLRPVSIVIGADRASWWIAESATPSDAIVGTARYLGVGALAPFAGFTLDVDIDGMELEPGDAVLCTLNSVGTRDTRTVTLRLTSTEAGSAEALVADPVVEWLLAPERSRFDAMDG
jgi:prepilin-type N-terminal cleavage/methylation domain-containing protein